MTDDPRPDGAPESVPTLPASEWSPRPPSAAFDDDQTGEPGRIDDRRRSAEPSPVVTPRPRKGRDGRAGKIVGRAFRIVFVLGVAVALLLTIGRSLVFPDQWTAEVAPFVDELQTQYDVEFADSLEFVELPEAVYARRVTETILGPGWADRLPEWRALGLVGGRAEPAQVEAVLAGRFPAHFDPTTRSIVASQSVLPADRSVALQLAVRVALADELAGGARETGPLLGLTGVDRLDELSWWSIDEAMVGLGFEFFDDPTTVPLPVAYLMRAPTRIGRVLTGGARLITPGTTPLPGQSKLDDGAIAAAAPVLAPTDRVLLDPAPLGSDDWTLIWGARLDPPLAVQMADLLVADSYAVVERDERTCAIATVQGADSTAADVLADGLAVWVASAPPETAGVVRLDDVTVRLEACDPGAVALPPQLTVVEVVIGRQLARIAG